MIKMDKWIFCFFNQFLNYELQTLLCVSFFFIYRFFNFLFVCCACSARLYTPYIRMVASKHSLTYRCIYTRCIVARDFRLSVGISFSLSFSLSLALSLRVHALIHTWISSNGNTHMHIKRHIYDTQMGGGAHTGQVKSRITESVRWTRPRMRWRSSSGTTPKRRDTRIETKVGKVF